MQVLFLDFTEGKSTQLEFISDAMAGNGNQEPVFYTDHDLILFMVQLPYHPELQGTKPASEKVSKSTLHDVELIFANGLDFQSISILLDIGICNVVDHIRNLIVTKSGTMSVTKSRTKFIKLVNFLAEARSRSEILNFLEIDNQTKNFTTNMKPLLENGIIELTIPDKPQSRFQMYRLTEKGKKLRKQ
ncbi:MAG: hypothetical protein WCK09_19810 [Bacteroidota bacterium]